MTSATLAMRGQHINSANNRLHGRALLLARGVWVALVLLALGLLASSLPRLPHLLAQFQTPCLDTRCSTGMLSPDALDTLHRLGLSASAFAIFYAIVYALVPLAVFVAVGLFLAWRKSDDWLALLVSLFLILFELSTVLQGLIASSAFSSAPLSQLAPVWFTLFYYFCQGLAFPVLALFPNGRFVPRWMLWPTLALVVLNTLAGFPPPHPLVEAIGFPVELSLFACLAGSMIYRFRHGATLLERQQIKWLAFFIVLDLILNWIGPVALALLFPQTYSAGSLLNVLYQLVWPLTILGIPISIGIAILRYRLWDIDVLIRRTLIYGSLTAILVGVYLALVLGAQSALHALTGQRGDEPLIIVASTLLIAALFNPLRKRLQRTIDRRFYRARYNATKTLERFAATLRQHVELGQLQGHLVAVVEETMRPAHVSLWLRADGRQKEAKQ